MEILTIPLSKKPSLQELSKADDSDTVLRKTRNTVTYNVII